MSMHSTRRTRREAPNSSEVPCSVCRATVLANLPWIETLAPLGYTHVYVTCPSCVIATTDPDEHMHTIPLNTIDELERAGVTDARALISEFSEKPLHELAANVLRNTVGGQG